MKTHLVCWKWKSSTYRTKYTAEHVNILLSSFIRRCKLLDRVVCVTDDPVGIKYETHPLWSDCDGVPNPNGPHFPSCFRRLKIFSRRVQEEMGIEPGDRVISTDLDAVVTGDLTPMFRRDEDFVGWKGIGSVSRSVVYCGALFMFRAGKMEKLWTDFDPIESPKETRRALYFGSDQGWLSYKLKGSVPGWDVPDILSYSRDMQRPNALPVSTRIVCFNGKRKPWEEAVQQRDPWIRSYWKE